LLIYFVHFGYKMSIHEKHIAININFDSLNEAFGFPKGFRDPSYFEAFERVAKLADYFNIRFSIYVIGKDLENPEIFVRVREWSDAGHEIGNHTWSHPMNLGALRKDQVRSEIIRSHEIITKCTGREPKGFISPAWSTSSYVVSTLIELKYTYDTSIFPSVMLFPMAFKMALNHLNNRKKMKTILNRRDWLYPFTKPMAPYFADANYKCLHEKNNQSILVLPLPTLSRFSFPCWHTIGFLFGWDYAERKIKRNIMKTNCFYYLMHPADFVGQEDIQSNHIHSLERMNIGIRKKIDTIKRMFHIINSCSPVFLTLEQISNAIIKEKRLSRKSDG